MSPTETTTGQPPAAESGLPKQYRPSEHEKGVWESWIAAGAFHADPGRVVRGEAEPYCILIPPPNVTAALHLGHALNNTLQDVLTRAHRMRGFETLWMPGTDHAGIATQAVVEKRVQKEEKKRRTDFTREEFIAKIQAFKDEYEAVITGQLKAMGCSCDWDRQRFTMDPVCARAVREAFFRLFKDGLIYRGKRLVNWDPVLQTAVADDECYDEEVASSFWYLRYPLVHPHGATTQRERRAGQLPPDDAVPVTWSELALRGFPGAEERPPEEEAWVTVATTRPETYLGDTAVAVNPHDPRAKALRGLCVELPLVGRIIPIIEDDYVVLPKAMARTEEEAGDPKAEYATGFLKVTPAHDANDYDLYQRHKERIDTFAGGPGRGLCNMMSPEGRVSDKHGWVDVGDAHLFVGKKMAEARALVVKEFEARGLLESVRPYSHSVKHSDRSKAVIEPYLSDQWYVRVTDPRMAKAANAALVPDQRTQGGGADQGRTDEGRTGLQTSSQGVENSEFPPLSHFDFLNQPVRTLRSISGFQARDPYPTGALSPRDIIEHRRYLPHVELTGATYFVTWRTFGGTSLAEPERAAAIQSLLHWHGDKVFVYAAVVMPDHVHCLVKMLGDEPLGAWVGSVKKFSARAIQAGKGAKGPLWQEERFDHIVRDAAYFGEFAEYIIRNPVEAGLAGRPADYPALAVNRTTLEAVSPARTGLETSSTVKTSSNGSMRFFPARYAKTFEQWHDNIRDWCISRQLWWGHRIPVWSCEHFGGGAEACVKFEQDLVEWQNQGRVFLKGRAESDPAGLMSNQRTDPDSQFFVCVRSSEDQEIIRSLERWGFTQDPDVLDTWFSSALWPLSTMGWPDGDRAAAETGIADFPSMLAAFNPTSSLSTAREIITLWVSRMTMFNRYFLGPVPFKEVFIHAVIQDGEGRKMSKTLGNGVDPLDIIESHGADAMRYTLCTMATNTQDVRLPVVKDGRTGKNTSPKFDIGRNFANKVWNAARFTLTMLQGGPAAALGSGGVASLSLADRWMLSRLAAAIESCDRALANYEFAEYAQSLYDVVWRDFCDWYLEAVKPTIASNPGQRTMLCNILSAVLRLLHPAMPFMTEAVWRHVGTLDAPAVPGLSLSPARKGGLLATVGWPVADGALRDPGAEAEFARLQAAITAVREVRAVQNVAPRRRITLHAPGLVASWLRGHETLVSTLAMLDGITDNAPPQGAASLTFEGAALHLSGLHEADEGGGAGIGETERAFLTKRKTDLEKEIKTYSGRLASPGYTQKAPPSMVQETTEKLEKARAELALVEGKLGAP